MSVSDRTVEFQLVKKTADALPAPSAPLRKVCGAQGFDAVDESIRLETWDAKTKLDAIDPRLYNSIRDSLFPLAHSGARADAGLMNRAGHKLLESMEATGVWQRVKAAAGKDKVVAFADVCGGPGAFSQALHGAAKQKQVKLRGFGMTLMDAHKNAPQGWYPDLAKRHKFVATFGVDGMGNIFNTANVNALTSLVVDQPLLLVVADGGFDLPFSISNYQEPICSRIVFSQWLTALRILKTGGCFVLKLFDTFTPMTRSMLFLSLFFYDRVHIVKPRHSRVVNSERYLVCLGMREVPAAWADYLMQVHEHGFNEVGEFMRNEGPVALLDPSVMVADEPFLDSLRGMNATIARNQVTGIGMIVSEFERRKDLPVAVGDAPPGAAEEVALGEQQSRKRERDDGAPAAPAQEVDNDDASK